MSENKRAKRQAALAAEKSIVKLVESDDDDVFSEDAYDPDSDEEETAARIKKKKFVVSHKNCHAIVGDDSDEDENEDFEYVHVFSESEGEEEVKYVKKISNNRYDIPILEEPAFSLEDLCRLCAQKKGDMVHIFGNFGMNLDLQSKIHALLPIRIEKKDCLPKVLCQECVDLVNQCHQLIASSQEADKILRALFKERRELFQLKEDKSCSESEDTETVSYDPIQYDSDGGKIVCPDIFDEATIKDYRANHPLLEEKKMKKSPQRTPRQKWVEPAIQYDSDGEQFVCPEILDTPKIENYKTQKKKCSLGLLLSSSTTLENLMDANNDNKSSSKWVTEGTVHLATPDKTFELIQCADCPDNFPSFRSYKRHMRQSHQVFVCEHHSDFRGHSRDELKMHLKFCASFLCSICGKSYSQKSHLNRHAVSHGEKNVSCEICGKLFHHHENLLTHQRTHNQDKDLPCQFCGRRFKQLRTLKKHENAVHAKSWTYHCKICGLFGISEIDVAAHCRVHSSEQIAKFGTKNLYSKRSIVGH